MRAVGAVEWPQARADTNGHKSSVARCGSVPPKRAEAIDWTRCRAERPGNDATAVLKDVIAGQIISADVATWLSLVEPRPCDHGRRSYQYVSSTRPK